MKTAASLAAFSLATFLAACGGGGSGSGSDVMSADEMSARFNALEQRFVGSPSTPLRLVPDSGTVSYSGVAQVEEHFGSRYTGFVLLSEIDLRADFGRGEVSGQMTNFRTEANAPAPGSVALTGEDFDEDEFYSLGRGVLTLAGVEQGVSGWTVGRFVGRDAQGIDGFLRLNVGTRTFAGDFFATSTGN